MEPPILFGEWIVKKLQTYAEWQGFVLPDRSNRYRNEAGQIAIRDKVVSADTEVDTENQVAADS